MHSYSLNQLLIILVSSSCRLRERNALLTFKQGITSDPADLLVSWQRQGGPAELDCCRWRGVRCNKMTGRVLKLQLRNEHTPLIGQISPSLLDLEYLEHLDLSMNYLEGASGRIPDFLSSLKNLKYLNLSFIPFSGTVPPQLGNLSRLQYLDLSGLNNAYSTDVSWLARLSLLQHLDLSSVNLSTVADWPQVLNRIPSLRILRLSNCRLGSANQSLPHHNLTNLEALDLSENSFNHPIASSWFWNLTRLEHLSASATNTYGQLPNVLGRMATLQFLDLSSNRINLLRINMTNLCSLRILRLEFCLANGNMTELIESLPRCSSNKLQELHLASNQLTGHLPNSTGHLTSLVMLDANNNNISGPLHNFIGHLANLETLDLSRNNFKGHLPSSIREFTRLRILDLSHNNLTGHVPHEIGTLTKLTKLCLNNNELDGVITEDHFAVMRRLQYVDLSYNSLKIQPSSDWKPPFRLNEAFFAACQMGPLFPAWLQWQVDIYYLDISSTGIIDRLPQWFSKAFSKYKYLNISSNQLNGSLPTNMDTMSLNGLYLSSNKLTGQIPTLPRNLTNLDISMNFLSGPLPSDMGVPMLWEAVFLNLFVNARSWLS